MIRDREKLNKFVSLLMDDGANFNLISKAYKQTGGMGNDRILAEGFEYDVNLISHPNLAKLYKTAFDSGLNAKYNAGSGWDFYEK